MLSLLRAHGLEAKSKLGQNFLVDLNLMEIVVRAAELSREDAVLEVGTGTGGLTGRLVEFAGAVVSAEIDPGLHALARQAVAGQGDRVRLILSDILRTKNELNRTVIDAWLEAAKAAGATRLKLVANLPYAVAVPVMANLLVSGPVPALQVGMVQWEIAERLAAKPGEDAFGAISVLSQSVAKVSIVRKIPPRAFFPAPKVDSAIVRLESDPVARAALEARLAKPGGPGPMERWRNFLRDLYCHRRKNVRGALVSLPGQSLTKPEIDSKLAAAVIDGNRRAETMGIEEHLRLCEVFG